MICLLQTPSFKYHNKRFFDVVFDYRLKLNVDKRIY
jgi:hypothetical protein